MARDQHRECLRAQAREKILTDMERQRVSLGDLVTVNHFSIKRFGRDHRMVEYWSTGILRKVTGKKIHLKTGKEVIKIPLEYYRKMTLS